MNENIFAVFAHPDDEVLACGGALANHVKNGDQVTVLILGTGLASRDETVADSAFDGLKDQSREALKALGIETVIFDDFPDNQLDTVPLLHIVKAVEERILSKPISRVYTHHFSDLNVDHQIVSRAVVTALRPCAISNSIQVLAGEVNSSTEWGAFYNENFQPNVYIDIENTIEQKVKALDCYKSELRDWPHPRSLEGIRVKAKQRGMESGLLYAEAFHLLLSIQR
jgi:LmbE family N-acetylglucosaminyl deacetylase